MLRKFRIIVATVVFALLTLLFLDFTGTLHLWFGWLAKIQLIPAILAGSVVILVILALLTIFFGRIYCSVICPLGVMQDGISNVSGRRKGKKNRFSYSKALSGLRYGVLALFIVGMIFGTLSIIVSFLDPYAGFGRIAANLLAPIYRLGNNVLAHIAESMNSYAFHTTSVWIKSGITFGVAVATLLIVGVLAWRHGRTYCNTICPVGTFLGFISRFSMFKPVLGEGCDECGLCEKRCKASCIDSKNKVIDYSRCVTCFNCIESCKVGAVKYAFSCCCKKETAQPEIACESGKDGISRRSFMTIAGTVVAAQALEAQQGITDGGLAEIENKRRPVRNTPIVPPGSQSLRNMQRKCTACQLCVSACPNNVLRPSNRLATLMQPEMSFERGWCRVECVECSLVCPTSAIQRITPAEKTGISIGYAVWIRDNCIVHRDDVQCRACERNCPTGAITLVTCDGHPERNHRVPVVDKNMCNGCGACEFFCPARPFSAIYVEGHAEHQSI